MSPEEMRARFAAERVARLATVTPLGDPHLVPCCFALVGDVVVSVVDGKPKSTPALRRLANVRANPSVALLVDHYADDWTTLWWVRVDGRGRVIEGGEEHDEAVSCLTRKYEQYTIDPPRGPVLAVDIVTWRGWP